MSTLLFVCWFLFRLFVDTARIVATAAAGSGGPAGRVYNRITKLIKKKKVFLSWDEVNTTRLAPPGKEFLG